MSKKQGKIKQGKITLQDFYQENTPDVPLRKRVERAVKLAFGAQAELVEILWVDERNHFTDKTRGTVTETCYSVTYMIPDE